MRKYASLEVLGAWRQRPGRIAKQAHRVGFEYAPRDGYLYVRSRMISSRTNDNHDTFPAEEIEKGYRSFLGKPVFVNHHNSSHRRARGVIVAVALHRDRNADGTPDTWVEGLMEVDAVRFPKLAQAILAKRVNRTSMGVDVDWSTCSACGNKATSPAEYCRHLPAMKGQKIRKRNPVTGKVEEKLIHEVCMTPETPILMADGTESAIASVRPGDMVTDHLGQPRRVLSVMSREVSEDIVVLEKYGYWKPVRLTANHPVLVLRRSGTSGGVRAHMESRLRKGKIAPEFIPAGELKPGDFVCEVVPLPQETLRKIRLADWEVPDPENRREHAAQARPDRYYTPERAWGGRQHILRDCRSCGKEMDLYPSEAARMYCSSACWGDGYARGNTAHGGSDAREIPDSVEMSRDFGEWCGWFLAEGSSHRQASGAAHSVRFSLHANEDDHAARIAALGRSLFGIEPHFEKKGNRQAVIFCSAPLTRFMRSMGESAYAKSLPDEWMSAPMDFIDGVVTAHYLGDGDHGGGRVGGVADPQVMTHATSSERLADQLHIMHLMLGHTPTRKRPDMPGGPSKRTVPGHFVWAPLNRDAKGRMTWDRWVFAPLRSVDRVPYAGTVHNLEIEETHTYVANHVAVHNCAGLSFFENSLLVEDPADPTAYFIGDVDARGLKAKSASRREASFTPSPDRCANCGIPFGSGDHGDMGSEPHPDAPLLCQHCYHGNLGGPEHAGLPPAMRPADAGGTRYHPLATEVMYDPADYKPGKTRPWESGDSLRSSLSSQRAAAKAEGGDHPWFRQHPVKAAHIIAAYHDSTDDEKASGHRWYSDAHHVAKAIASGDAALGAGLLSAYSPRTLWPVNLFNASRAMHGDPPGPGSGAMGDHQKKAIRILAGEHHSKVLTAPKTSAFAHLIEHGGDTKEDEKHGRHRVVVDRHAMSVATGKRLSDEDMARCPVGQSQHYEHVEHEYREAAHFLSEATGKKISPHQVQATTWLRQIRKNNEEDSSGARGGGGKGRVKMQDNSRSRWVDHHREHHPGAIPEENMHYHGTRKLAYEEIRVPPQVDTLRMDECPVCGEHNVWSGARCPVCGFVVPPSVFRDPDTDKAQQVRNQLDADGEVSQDPQGPGIPGEDDPADDSIGSGDDVQDQLVHPDQIAPDGVPAVQGGDGAQQGPDTDGLPPEAQDPEAGEEDPGTGPDGQDDPAGMPEDQPGDDLECPACGTTFETDAAAQPGVPCPACGMASLHLIDEDEGGEDPGDPRKDQEDPSDPEDEQEEDEDMAGSKTAAAIAQAQAQRIAVLTAENELLHRQMRFIASAAGVEPQMEAIRQEVFRRHADILNPASPVPDPPEGPPAETTEQALMPEAMDNASRPGSTPGANSRVPAQQTTTAITPGVEMQTPPATNLIDVTAPVQGTNPSQDGGVPLEQRRIETDVRIDPNPLKAEGPGIGGQGSNGTAFPWILDAQPGVQQGQQRAASLGGAPAGEADASRRTFASIRLARLRVQAGLAQGDELAVAEQIEHTASLPVQMIEHEIGVLSRIPQAQARYAQPIQRQGARQAPSLASVGAASQYAPAVTDDLDGSDIFL